MSLSSDTINMLQNQLNSRYTALVPIIFTMFDWVTTMDQEVDLIWNNLRKKPILFLVNRYAQVLAVLLQLATSWGPQVASTCHATGYIVDALNVVLWVTIAVFSALRVWVLTGKKRLLPSLVLCLGLIPAAANLFVYTETPFIGVLPVLPDSPKLCEWFTRIDPRSQTLLILAPTCRAASLLGDGVVLIVTWMKTYRSYASNRKLQGHQFQLSSIMLLNGSGYFGTIVLFNAMQLIFPYVLVEHNIGALIGEMNRPISTILISKFMLDLKQSDRSHNASTLSAMSDIEFDLPQIFNDASESEQNVALSRHLRMKNDNILREDVERGSPLEEGSDTTYLDSEDHRDSPVPSSDTAASIDQVSRHLIPRSF